MAASSVPLPPPMSATVRIGEKPYPAATLRGLGQLHCVIGATAVKSLLKPAALGLPAGTS
jgi:hypothetical protein